MKKIISFSLYGNKPNFQVGAVVNVLEAKRLYPDWKCRFYTTDDEGICKQLEYLGAEIVRMDDWPDGEMFWRFLAVDDADICLSRDADSVVNEREVGAVNEWLESGYQWHGMHDHRQHRHFPIMAGMWGYRHYGDHTPEKQAQESACFFNFRNKSMKTYIDEWLDANPHEKTAGRGSNSRFMGSAIIYGKAKTNMMRHGRKGDSFPPHVPCRYGNFVGDYSFWKKGWRRHVNGDQDVFIQYKSKEAIDSGLPEVVCIYHNLGLGDHILMNGPIRHILDKYDFKELRLICKESNYNNVAYMYRDEPKIKVMSIKGNKKWHAEWRKRHEDNITKTVSELKCHRSSSIFPDSDKETISFRGGRDLICPEESIYNNFYIQRDDKTESDKMEKILSENGLDAGDKYAFVCVSCSVGTDPKLLEEIKAFTGIPLIIAKQSVEYKGGDCSTPVDYNGVIFEWMKIIEEASEIHTVDTSFFHLINGMNLKNVGKFFWKSFGRKFLDHWKKDGWEVRD